MPGRNRRRAIDQGAYRGFFDKAIAEVKVIGHFAPKIDAYPFPLTTGLLHREWRDFLDPHHQFARCDRRKIPGNSRSRGNQSREYQEEYRDQEKLVPRQRNVARGRL